MKPESLTNETSTDSYATLETINDDCLREIFQYFNLRNATNLALTCTRLMDFAESEFFPKAAKEVELTTDQNSYYVPNYSMSDANWQSHFRCFGMFVEHLILSYLRFDVVESANHCSFEETLKNFPYVKKLTIKQCELNGSGVPDQFFQHCKSLTNLSIKIDEIWTDGSLTKFNTISATSHCLFAGNLPNLTSLTLRFCKSTFESCNLLLRMLSDRGIIQDLSIDGGSYFDEDINQAPLVFNQLQRIKWISWDDEPISLLKAITRAQMPTITEFDWQIYVISEDENNITHNLLAFVQSKDTLKLIKLRNNHMKTLHSFRNPFAIVHGIIKILKTQSRPVLCLKLPDNSFGDKEEELFDANKHLIQVQSKSIII